MNHATIEQITTDHRFQTLKYYQEKTNVFTIVGQTHTEHWHSSFLKWLLDPSSSLCLGHFPIARLLNLYLIKSKYTELSLKDIYKWDLDALRFQNEKTIRLKNGGKRSIDVYGESPEIVIVIENKVKATENYNNTDAGQTKDYYNHIEATKNPIQKSFYFFITPNPTQKPFHNAYIHITYQEMYDHIISKCIQHPQLNNEGRYLLEQYSNNLREPVKDSPMALVNIELCKDLYDTYQKALDEIFADVEQSAEVSKSDKLSCVFYNRYRAILDEIYLSVDEKYGRTPKSVLSRSSVSLTDLYNAGIIADGTMFSMEYSGALFYAVAEYDKDERKCYLLVLDENKKPYIDENGEKYGYYPSASQAGIDAINIYREKHGITERVTTLRGTTYWKTEAGQTMKELIDSI